MRIIKKIKSGLLISSLLFLSVAPLALAGNVSAQVAPESKQAACDGIGGAVGKNCDQNAASASVTSLVREAISLLSWIVGIIAIFMIIIAGLKFITANGDANSIASARSTLIYALVGVAVAALAQLMVRFVLGKVT